ncbi:MAG: hypothetical protein NC117_00635 [Pseudoflavonifractor sp.]|nr:hypothetical protein [Pseudoflavonifractor sp.]
MKLTLSSTEMLDIWRMRRALLPLREDCVVERSDGIDVDMLLRHELRQWYVTLLDTAPFDMLVLTDIASDVAPMPCDDGSVAVTLPQRCRRVAEVSLDGWTRPALMAAPGSPLALRQTNPYSRGRIDAPVAVVYPGRIILYSAPAGSVRPRLDRLLCVVEPDEGFYQLDERALGLIPGPDTPLL